MHLEINAGGLGAAMTVSEYQSNMKKFISDSGDVVDSFKAVKTAVRNLNGGVGNLTGAMNSLSRRVTKEEGRARDAKAIQAKTNSFFELAIRVDKQVSKVVNKNKDEFYRIHPWLKPPHEVPSDAPWYEKAWSWLCKAGDKIGTELKKGWDWLSDTARKATKAIVDFWKKNKYIIIDTFVQVVLPLVASAVVAALSLTGVGAIAAFAIAGALAAVSRDIFTELHKEGSLDNMNWGKFAADVVVSAVIGGLLGPIGDKAGNAASNAIKVMKPGVAISATGEKVLRFVTKSLTLSSINIGFGFLNRAGSETIKSFFNDWKISRDEWLNVLEEVFNPSEIHIDAASGLVP